MIRILPVLFLFSFLFSACSSDSGGGNCSDGILGDTEYTIDCGGDCPFCLEFFEGGWISEGDNLSPVWKELFMAKKIELELDPGSSYRMKITDEENKSQTGSGTYSLSDSGTKNIWTIRLQQSNPDQKVYEGIVQAESNYILKVEIVQTEPYINAIPPSPEEGLGSTKTETDGNRVPFPGNIHTFIRD